ncbi:MAG: hypothetical protein GYA52_08935 [Chloroflexi bacterium]|nr:hypothetical protein [Chloroflexota bacterium]
MHTPAKVASLFLLFLTSACAAAVPASPTVTATSPPTDTAIPSATPQPTVTPTLQATAVTSKPQTVNLYLVAIGDNGASGEPIGCGDSLVTVEVAIEPTSAVLRAALTALLSLPADATYGQSGLYNALYLSDLQIESLEITDRQATMRLTGDLIYGGECDIPRIEAQLTSIALQFSTVDSVSVYINGTLLSDLLDLRG